MPIREKFRTFVSQILTIMNHEISIKQGYGDIRFDMPVEEVVAIMGNATEVENIDNAEDESTTVLRYDDRLTLFFEGENPTLACIDIYDEEATLFGKEVFHLDEKALVKLMVANNYYEQDVENEDWGERRVTFGEGNIDFFFDDGELVSIIIGK